MRTAVEAVDHKIRLVVKLVDSLGRDAARDGRHMARVRNGELPPLLAERSLHRADDVATLAKALQDHLGIGP